MLPEPLSYEKEVKEIWEKEKNNKSAHRIYQEDLKKYFDGNQKDWMFLMNWIKIWKRREVQNEITEGAKTMTDEGALELQNENRKRAILMLSRVLGEYGKNPKSFKNIPINQISKLYQTIQSLEEASKRTELAAFKEKRETVRMFLPYQRMSFEQLQVLQQLLNASFARILQLRGGDLQQVPSSTG